MCDCNRNRNRFGGEARGNFGRNGSSGCGCNGNETAANANFVLASSPVCCNTENPFFSERRVCCDCDGECCGCFNQSQRDCFWPDFTHPSWLCCSTLYSCSDTKECPARENAIDDEDRFEDGICTKCRKRH